MYAGYTQRRKKGLVSLSYKMQESEIDQIYECVLKI